MIKYNISKDITLPKKEKILLLKLLTFIDEETKCNYIIELNIFYISDYYNKSTIKYKLIIKTKDELIYNFIEFNYYFSYNTLNDNLIVTINSFIEMLLKWMCFGKSVDIILNNGYLINYKSFTDLINMSNTN